MTYILDLEVYNLSWAVVSLNLTTSPVSAVDSYEVSKQVIGSEGGRKATKAALDAALTVAQRKRAMTTATTIVCLECLRVAGSASPWMCIACGILVAKRLG